MVFKVKILTDFFVVVANVPSHNKYTFPYDGGIRLKQIPKTTFRFLKTKLEISRRNCKPGLKFKQNFCFRFFLNGFKNDFTLNGVGGIFKDHFSFYLV